MEYWNDTFIYLIHYSKKIFTYSKLSTQNMAQNSIVNHFQTFKKLKDTKLTQGYILKS